MYLHLPPFIADLKAHHLALLITFARVFFSGVTQSSSNKSGHQKQNGFCSLPSVKFGIQSIVLFLFKILFRTFFSFQENLFLVAAYYWRKIGLIWRKTPSKRNKEVKKETAALKGGRVVVTFQPASKLSIMGQPREDWDGDDWVPRPSSRYIHSRLT